MTSNLASQIHSIEALRRAATRLKKAHAKGEAQAVQRVAAYVQRRDAALKHADFLHVIAREQLFESWPRLVAEAELQGLDRAARQQRLKRALFMGQMTMAERLLEETPDLADGLFGLMCALYDRVGVARMLDDDPSRATTMHGPRRPILHLAFSRWLQRDPAREGDMLAVAEMLLAHGADVNDTMPAGPASEHGLSALYGAIGHAGNMPLARWLLANGANPNDNESLYHATELGHHEGLEMLLAHGADPRGTNALLRAMDFHDHAAVKLLLAHGAKPDDFAPGPVGGEPPEVIPALHQAARRGCDGDMVRLLLEGGADSALRYGGVSAYALARAYGNAEVAEVLRAHGADTGLSEAEALLARAADGQDSPGRHIDPATLPDELRGVLHELARDPARLEHMRRLVALGVEYDRPGVMGLTPVQVAGWEGLPEVMDWILSLKPDLTHVNHHGGTLLGTILHGSEACPARDSRNHVRCLELALEHGLAFPRVVIDKVDREDVRAVLTDWAERKPGQVV